MTSEKSNKSNAIGQDEAASSMDFCQSTAEFRKNLGNISDMPRESLQPNDDQPGQVRNSGPTVSSDGNGGATIAGEAAADEIDRSNIMTRDEVSSLSDSDESAASLNSTYEMFEFNKSCMEDIIQHSTRKNKRVVLQKFLQEAGNILVK